MWSPTVARHVCHLLAVGIVSHVHVPTRHCGAGVPLISFLNSFLGPLERFLAAHLGTMCRFVHRECRLPRGTGWETEYDFESLCRKGFLTVSAALASGGADSAVVLFCLPHRQKHDWGGWALARSGTCN